MRQRDSTMTTMRQCDNTIATVRKFDGDNPIVISHCRPRIITLSPSYHRVITSNLQGSTLGGRAAIGH
ncbi:hypothetical protein DPMN_154872 [Dreissena polymorpha]|uniref:Uncharacterized protein n=1 Tax=Dreissena polymorpha TaxID=45954 RepID=A0A9D4FRP0_DREPO|nr:hypothetical protein DPMN_154872 [Dreissena polymorpha]